MPSEDGGVKQDTIALNPDTQVKHCLSGYRCFSIMARPSTIVF
jgi:hypothetical protein